MSTTPTPPRLPGSGIRFGNYQTTRLIGQGGMCAVFEAVHQHLGLRKAVKVLFPRYAEDPELVRRFLNEARALAAIDHPGLLRIEEQGRLPSGTPYILMELLAGHTLFERLREQGGRLPPREAISVGRQLAEVLACVHRAGIVHRDLKPSNVFLCSRPDAPGSLSIRLLDFGVAKFLQAVPSPPDETLLCTAHDAVLGTPSYMAPEQARGGGDVDAAADVYALGVLLYQTLSGGVPFVAPDTERLLEMQRLSPAPALAPALAVGGIESGEHREVASLVERMLAKAPADRPAMGEVAARLQRLEAALDGPAAAGPAVPAAPAPAPPRRASRRWLGAMALLLTFSWGAGFLVGRRVPAGAREDVTGRARSAGHFCRP